MEKGKVTSTRFFFFLYSRIYCYLFYCVQKIETDKSILTKSGRMDKYIHQSLKSIPKSKNCIRVGDIKLINQGS